MSRSAAVLERPQEEASWVEMYPASAPTSPRRIRLLRTPVTLVDDEIAYDVVDVEEFVDDGSEL